MQHRTTSFKPLGMRLPCGHETALLGHLPLWFGRSAVSAALVMTMAVLQASTAASSSHLCHLQVTRMTTRTERMRRGVRGTSSADPPPPRGPGHPRMGLHQVGP